MFAGLTLAGELWPLRVRRRHAGGVVTTSSAFAYALMLMFGIVAAVVVQGLASLAADLVGRRGAVRTLFNFGQYVVSLAAGGLVLSLAVGTSFPLTSIDFTFAHLPALLLAGAVVFLLQNVFTAGAIALSQHGSVWDSFREDLAFNASTAGLLLTLSPILVVVADHSPALLPLPMITMLALFRSANVTLEKEHEALHDLLTDLPNRRLFNRRATSALFEAKRTGEPVGLFRIDLDRFKDINDTLGHHVGDAVLRQIGPRLRSAVREVDTVARLGGDEFALLVRGIDDVEQAASIASRMASALEEPILVQGFPLSVAASVGVALYPDHGKDVDVLLERADAAMYVAKREQLGACVFANERDRDRRGRMSLLSELRRAIDEDQLVMHY